MIENLANEVTSLCEYKEQKHYDNERVEEEYTYVDPIISIMFWGNHQEIKEEYLYG